MNVPRAVFDTMVFVQAAIRPERRYASFAAIAEQRLSLCLSPQLLAEITDVLSRPAMILRFNALTPDRVARFLQIVNATSTMFADVPPSFTLPHHPDDDHLFNLAIRAQATYLVTWETRILRFASDASPYADLLRKLAPNLSIVTPKQLAETLKPANG